MGYTFCTPWNTAAKVVENRVGEYKTVGRYVTHKKVGNCLWMIKKDVTTGKPFIALDLLEKSGSNWGYKDMAECMHPYYYSCPLEYLDMCEETCAEWRAKVREFHEHEAEIKQLKKSLKVGDTLCLKGCKIPSVVVQSIKPLRGTYNGKLYSLNWKYCFMSKIKENSDVAVHNAVRCTICGATADRYASLFRCTKNFGHIADLNTGIFSDLSYPQDEVVYQNDTQKEQQ